MNLHETNGLQKNSFVCLSYSRHDFLFPRSAVYSSMYSGICRSDACTGCRSIEGNSVPVFCLDSAVRSLFSDESGGNAAAVIVINTVYFTKSTSSALQRLCFKTHDGIRSTDCFGIETTAPAKIIDAPPAAFSLLPGRIGKVLRSKGISAVRFTDNKKIQFLLDFEYLIQTLSENNA